MEPTTRNDTQTTACRRQSSMRKTLSLALASSFMRGRCAKPSSTARAVPATRARPHRQTELACSSGAVHTSRQWTGRDQHGRHGSGSQTPKTGKNKSSRSTVTIRRSSSLAFSARATPHIRARRWRSSDAARRELLVDMRRPPDHCELDAREAARILWQQTTHTSRAHGLSDAR